MRYIYIYICIYICLVLQTPQERVLYGVRVEMAGKHFLEELQNVIYFMLGNECDYEGATFVNCETDTIFNNEE